MTGNEEYAKARAAALRRGREPRDPLAAGPGRDPRLVVAELTRPCTCGCPQMLHHLTDPSPAHPAGRRTYCTVATAAGRDGCETYEPAAIVPSDPD